MDNKKNKYGQYMTPETMSDFMVSLITKDKDAIICEPSCGEGAFIDSLLKFGFSKIEAYEIDREIINKKLIPVHNTSYINTPDKEKYDVIIGNPPYIRWKNLESELKVEVQNYTLWNKYCNALCDYSTIFMVKAIFQLKDQGELIFITPEYWLKTTHAQDLRDLMVENGYFEEIFHFNETPIFKDSKVSLIVFKYIKSKNKNKNISVIMHKSNKYLSKCELLNLKDKKPSKMTNCFEIPQFKENTIWTIAEPEVLARINNFEKACTTNSVTVTLGDKCKIGNGLVSGLDKAFQLGENTELNKEEKNAIMSVVKAKNLNAYYHGGITNYIFLNNNSNITESVLKNKYPNFHTQLIKFKDKLNDRYCYGRNINYWEWVFLRNYDNLFSLNTDKIMVPCKERINNKNSFRFSYAEKDVFPTQDVTAVYLKNNTKESIFYILAMLNSKEVFEWVSYRGVRKGDIVEFCEKPLSIIPYREINFNDLREVGLYDKINKLVINYIKTKEEKYKEEIQICFSELIGGKDVC